MLQQRIRSMTEGALIAGIYLILFLVSVYTPLGIVTIFFLPLPFIVYALRHPWKWAILMGLLAMGLGFVVNGIVGMFNSFLFASVGIVMGIVYQRRKPALYAVLAGTGMTMAQMLGALAVSIAILQVNPLETMEKMISTIQFSEEQLRMFGVDPEYQKNLITSMGEVIKEYFVSFLILSSVFYVMINHVLANKLMKRLGVNLPSFPPFREWSWPKSILYYYLVVLIFILIPDIMPSGFLATAINNLSYILFFMMMIQGLSYFIWLTYHKQWHSTIRVVAIAGLFFVPLLLMEIYSLLGIIDLGFNLRKRHLRK